MRLVTRAERSTPTTPTENDQHLVSTEAGLPDSCDGEEGDHHLQTSKETQGQRSGYRKGSRNNNRF